MNKTEQLERFRTELSRQGLKFTRQRETIATAFFSSEQHVTLQDLLDMARERRVSIGYATVYRTMKLMVECGLANEHRFSEGQARYEPLVEGEHHDHIICLQCGHIVEFEDSEIEKRQEQVAHALGFDVVSHRHEIYANCVKSDCEHRS